MPPVKRLAPLFALFLLAACEKSVGDTCEGTECGENLACLNKTCQKCEGSDRCASYGMCRAASGRCEIPAGAEADCKNLHGKKRYAPCEQDGKCKVVNSVCWAASDEDCKNSRGCRDNGACSAVEGRCVPNKPNDCHGSKVCIELAHCTVKEGRCALTSSADCQKSQACLAKGQCTLREKNCMVGGDDDCKASSMCKVHGACTARDGACQP